MKNILIFGATGRLGINLVKNLIKSNKVFANVHLTKLKENNKNLFKQKINLKNKTKIISFLKKKNINLIINCIALTNIEKCEKNKTNSHNLNFTIPFSLSKLAKQLNIQFVHISTDMLYVNKKKINSERSKTQAHNHYSRMKIMAENHIKKYKRSLIIRTNFFGYSTKKNPTFSDKIIFNLSKRKKLYLWDDVYFTPVYIGTLIKIINLLVKKNRYGIYNVSSNECISKYNLGKKIAKLFYKKNLIYKNKFDKKKFINRPMYMCSSNKKILKQFPFLKKDLILKNQLNILKKDFYKNNYNDFKR